MHDIQRNAADGGIDHAAYDDGLRAYMLRIFNLMAGGLGITGLTAWFVAASPDLSALLFDTPLHWVVILAPLAFVWVIASKAATASLPALRGMFWGFSALMGLSLASVFAVYTGESIARAFFITAATFAGAALYGHTTKRDLANLGGFLMVGLIGLILASLVNLVLGSSALGFALSVITVLVFPGLTAWDTQRLVAAYSAGWGNDANERLAIMGALSLYLNVINLFQAILGLSGSRSE